MLATLNAHTLPVKFQQLEPLVEVWALSTELLRVNKRVSSSFEDLRMYYDTVGPLMRDICVFLNAFPVGPIDDLNLTEKNLLCLALMYMEVAIPVEFFGEPDPLSEQRRNWRIESV